MAVLGDKVDGHESLRSPIPRAHRSWTPTARALAAAGDHWTLLIVQQLASGRMRLQRLRTSLPGVSTGVLERYVQQMVAIGLLQRTRYKEMPPRVELELTAAGRELVPIAAELSRWGMRHMWTIARDGESIDVEALLCLLPILLEGTRDLPEGSLHVTSLDASGEPVHRFFKTHRGRLVGEQDASEGNAESCTAHVEGPREAWVAAFCPDSVHDGLRITGDERLAKGVLDALHAHR